MREGLLTVVEDSKCKAVAKSDTSVSLSFSVNKSTASSTDSARPCKRCLSRSLKHYKTQSELVWRMAPSIMPLFAYTGETAHFLQLRGLCLDYDVDLAL